MVHFYESILIDTIDGLQFKSYSNEHPEGYIIAKPKYIPSGSLEVDGLRYRFLFEKCMIRFNLFAEKEKLILYMKQFKEKFPDYILEDGMTGNWYFVVPKDKIKTIHDPREGLQELMKVPEKDLDSYLRNVRELITFLGESGIELENIGIAHSTLLGDYTPGKSDIDLIIFGKENGWRILDFLKTANHEKLHWKTDGEWAEYYKDHKTSESAHFTEEEYVKHMKRKKYEGIFGGDVFTLFTVENPEETWFKWGEEKCEPLGIVTIKGKVVNHYNSIVRPGCYEVEDVKITENQNKIKIEENIPVTKVVTFSIPFVQQALRGETIEACGLLELVTPKQGERYHRVVIGYFDAYTNERREKEFIKAII